MPPSGHVAGIYARTDAERGVHKAPANNICYFRDDGRSIRVWSARTMPIDPLRRYVNVRRLFIMIEESLQEGMKWVVFEPNDETT